MKAVGLYRHLPIQDPESLLDVDMPVPEPSGFDLLVRVKAVSVNPVDVKVRAPKDEVRDTPLILGWDASGIVEIAGPDCLLFKPGDEVYYAGDLTRPGSYSDFQLVDERIVGRKPASLHFAQAAALPLTTLTAWEGLFERLNCERQASGKSILIIGAAGGVGSIATQLAHMVSLTVIGTASRPETIKWAKEHGADYTIDHHKDFASQLASLGFAHVDYIFCLNQTDRHWDAMVQVLAPEGKICSIVETKGPVNLTALQRKSATFAWEFMFTRSMFKTHDMIEQHKILNQVADLVDGGRLETTMTEQLSPINAENLRKAHARVEQGDMIGKIVISS